MTAFFKVPLAKLGEFEKTLAKAFKPAAQKAMNSARHQMLMSLRLRTSSAAQASDSPLSRPGAVAFGKLINGWNVDLALQSSSLKGRALGALEVYNTEDYAKYVEDGVKSGTGGISYDPTSPGFQAIEAWVNKRIGVGNYESKEDRRAITKAPKNRREGMMKQRQSAAQALTLKIIRAMNRRKMSGGWKLKPRNILGGAKEKLNGIFRRFLVAEITRAAMEAVKRSK